MESKLIHRMTSQRRVILEELAKLKCHPTADDVYEAVRRRLPHVSLGTVYRNLDVLAQSRALIRIAAFESPCRFDANVSPHHHITCTDCGRVADVMDLPGDFRMEPPENLSGYRVVGHRLEFMGVCPECQQKGGSKGLDSVGNSGSSRIVENGGAV